MGEAASWKPSWVGCAIEGCKGLTSNFALTRQCYYLTNSSKEVAERLCIWLETGVRGFNSLLSWANLMEKVDSSNV